MSTNIVSLIIITTIIGIIIFVSTQNILFIFSRELKEKEIETKVKNFVEIIEKISKLSVNYFYFECYLGLSNLSTENNILKIEIDKNSYIFYLPVNITNVKITKASKYCIISKNNFISILNCEETKNLIDGICTPQECKEASSDCFGPDKMCINDGYCNPYIGENCVNSPNDCKNDGLSKVCCPEDPSANIYGFTSKKSLGEECYCDDQCENGLRCNYVDKNFKGYKSGRACCPEGKVWNGKECIKRFAVECPKDLSSLPLRFDWRNINGINYLNPIRDQGSCGSCWAFASIGTVENVYNVQENCPQCNKDLSEQFLISYGEPCCGNSCGYGCQGGYPHLALKFIKNNGICDEDCYRYVGRDEKCNVCNDCSKRLWKIENFQYIYPDIERIKRALICYGPLLTASFKWTHAVVLVGYDDDSNICKLRYGKNGCWIIRNSWGVVNGIVYGVYHENGYGYIPYEGHTFSDLINYVFYVENVMSLT